MSKPRVIVIGGGPAGLIAAGQAAKLGAETMLLEKMDRPGRKLRITPCPSSSSTSGPMGGSCVRPFLNF